jgi:hypothetical protein
MNLSGKDEGLRALDRNLRYSGSGRRFTGSAGLHRGSGIDSIGRGYQSSKRRGLTMQVPFEATSRDTFNGTTQWNESTRGPFTDCRWRSCILGVFDFVVGSGWRGRKGQVNVIGPGW